MAGTVEAVIGESDRGRVDALLASLEEMAGGNLGHRARISDAHDEIDALAYAINVLVGELGFTTRGLKQAKADAEEANGAKTAFLRNISHEIRTPLSVIIGAAELLQLSNMDEARRVDLCERILRQGKALAALVDDLLDLSKVEAQRLTVEMRTVDPRTLVSEVVSALADEARRHDVRLSVGAFAEAAYARADARRLRQILMNVVGNALKFAPGGGVHVGQSPSDDPEFVSIDVVDDGVGISADAATLLFRPFQQADPSITTRFGGTGLGLMLSKHLAAAMGGDLRLVTSAEGKGSTFRILLLADERPSGV